MPAKQRRLARNQAVLAIKQSGDLKVLRTGGGDEQDLGRIITELGSGEEDEVEESEAVVQNMMGFKGRR